MSATATKTWQFSLVKGDDRYMVRCSAGKEEEAIAHLMGWAEDQDLNFDWFDAAVLSRQITQRLLSRAIGEPSED
ncbi:MAG: hypothetical protein IMZ55_08535 [Acidobacteria bacterium]|nr:hypothetical protein [Planctomycetota bacterium]MBE3133507.1 hypothetical protein [Acidobacteriota bacterium]